MGIEAAELQQLRRPRDWDEMRRNPSGESSDRHERRRQQSRKERRGTRDRLRGK